MDKKTMIIVAVVAIVVLLFAALFLLPAFLGFFPGLSRNTKITESNTYWHQATPVSIMESKIDSTGKCTLVLQNLEMSTITIKSIQLGSKTISINERMAPTDIKTINMQLGSTGQTGAEYEFSVVINYNKDGMDLVQTGAKPLVGKYS